MWRPASIEGSSRSRSRGGGRGAPKEAEALLMVVVQAACLRAGREQLLLEEAGRRKERLEGAYGALKGDPANVPVP